MPIDRDTAAEVARRHGLTLADAAGLVNLAEDEDDADRIAARFAAADDGDDHAGQVVREYAARLFGRDTEAEASDDPPAPANVSTHEGTNPTTPDGGEGERRRFVADLFGHPTRHDL